MNQLRKAQYDITGISPFGLKVTPRDSTQISTISPGDISALLFEHPLILFRGFDDLSRRELRSFAQTFHRGELLHWDFGPIMEMKVQPSFSRPFSL